MLVKTTVNEMRLLPRQQFELTVSLGGLNVDSGLAEARYSFVAMVFVDNVHQFVTGLKALGHKRQHYAVLFFFTGEERTGVTGARLLRSTDAYGLTVLFHGVTHSLGNNLLSVSKDRGAKTITEIT
jgi:hypothetical protein